MCTTISTTGGQIPGPSRRERRCAKNDGFVKTKATAWVISKTSHKAEKKEESREPLKRSDCKRVIFGAYGWKSHRLVKAGEGELFSLSGREAATLLVCFGIPAFCTAGDGGKGRRPSTSVIPGPKPSRRVLPQGECWWRRRLSARLRGREKRRSAAKELEGRREAESLGGRESGVWEPRAFLGRPMLPNETTADVLTRIALEEKERKAKVKESEEEKLERLFSRSLGKARRKSVENVHEAWPVDWAGRRQVVNALGDTPSKRVESPTAKDFLSRFF